MNYDRSRRVIYPQNNRISSSFSLVFLTSGDDGDTVPKPSFSGFAGRVNFLFPIIGRDVQTKRVGR